MLEMILYYFSWLCIFFGVFMMLTGAVGLVRMPDFYARIHAVGVADSMGVSLVLVGLAIQSGWTLVTAKIAILAFFLIITGPTATHALAKTALLADLKPFGKSKRKRKKK